MMLVEDERIMAPELRRRLTRVGNAKDIRLGIPSIDACRDVNGMRHAFAIHDRCGSGNPVLRRGGDYAVRLLGRYVDNNNTPTIPVKPSLCKPYGLFDLLKRLDLVEGTVMYDNTLYHVLVERRYVAMA
jgi:hypothetical protein